MSGDNANGGGAGGPAPIHGADPLAALFRQQAPADPQPAGNLAQLIAEQNQQAAASGESFDPAVHENVNGAPVRNLDGSYRLKRGRGSPNFKAKAAQAGASMPADLPPPPTAAESLPPPTPTLPYGPDEARRDAVLAVGTITASLQGFLGAQWKPDEDERDRMESELAAYCLMHGGLGIPPWLGVAMAFGMYAGRRVEVPLLGRIGGGGALEDQTVDEVERVAPPDSPIEQQPAAQGRPRPVTRPGDGTATAHVRPPVRLA